jgi:hypothetical protein
MLQNIGAPGHQRTDLRVKVKASTSAFETPMQEETCCCESPSIEWILGIILSESIESSRQIWFLWGLRRHRQRMSRTRVDERGRSAERDRTAAISICFPLHVMLRRICQLRPGLSLQFVRQQASRPSRRYATEPVTREDYFERRHMPSWWYRIHVDNRLTIWVSRPFPENAMY